MARAAASTIRSCVASLRPGAVRLIYDEHHKRVSHGAQASPVLRSFEPVLHTQKACRDRQASLVTAHFRETEWASEQLLQLSAPRTLSRWRSRISPTTASPEARGKLGAHRYERTTSALSARFEARDKQRGGECN